MYRTVTLYTGPNSLFLSLHLEGKEVDKPSVTQLPDPRCPALSADDVRAVVLAGISEANKKFGTAYFPSGIRFHVEAWPGGRLIQMGAFMIVERLATLGDGGFNMLPEDGSGV